MRLKDYCSVIAGQSPDGSSYNQTGEGVEFHQGKKAFGEIILEPSGVWTTETTKLAEPGDILISVRAPVGPTNLTDRRVCIGRGLAAIRCFENVNSRFILYALRNIESRIVGNDGAVFNSINKRMIEDLPVPEKDSNEQEKIVSYLDASFAKIDAIKANAEKQLQAAKDLFQAALTKAMTSKEGWEYKRVEEVCEVIGGTTPSTSNPTFWNGTLPWISPAELKGDKYIYNSVKKITMEAVNSKSLRLLPVNSIVLSSRAPIGKVAINKIPLYFNQGFKCIVCGPKIFSEFLYWWLVGKTEFLNSLGTGATFKEISKKIVEEIVIPVPPLSEQEKIVSYLDASFAKTNAIKTNAEKQIKSCDDLKQSLLKEVFD